MGRYQLTRFFEERGLLSSSLDMDSELARIVEHMRNGLLGKSKYESLPMIPSYLSLGNKLKVDQPVIVLSTGSIYFSIGLVELVNGGEIKSSLFQDFPMPGSAGEVTKETFYRALVDALIPYLEHSIHIAISFSFECEIYPNLDGKVINLSKEIRAPGVLGTFLAENISEMLAARGVTSKPHIIVLNNTVACLLGGFIHARENECSGYASLTLENGLNSAYVEWNENIEKLAGKIPEHESMIINMESGNYRMKNISYIDREIDLTTNYPGDHIFEKMISGSYQGIQAQYLIREAIEEGGIFSDFFAENFRSIFELNFEELNAFLDKPYGPSKLGRCCANDIDREHLYYIFENVVDRAARLVCVLLCAIHVQTAKGNSPTRPLAITIGGKSYSGSKCFRRRIRCYTKEFINEKHGFYNTFLEVQHAISIGSAIAVLTN